MPTAARLVVADVDGTLVGPDKVLTERTRAAVRRVVEAGIVFTITSGRPPLGMKTLIHTLDLAGPIIAFNGGLIVGPDLSVVRERLVSPEVARATVDVLAGHGLDVWVYGDDGRWYVSSGDGPHVDREEWTVGFAPTVVTSYAGLLARVVKIVGVAVGDRIPVPSVAQVRQQLGGGVSAALSQPYYLDVTHPEANKGEAIGFLSTRLGIPPEQIVTVGDMPNDVLMFRRSGVSIAMGNASAEVRAAATFVTASDTEEGFALAKPAHGDE